MLTNKRTTWITFCCTFLYWLVLDIGVSVPPFVALVLLNFSSPMEVEEGEEIGLAEDANPDELEEDEDDSEEVEDELILAAAAACCWWWWRRRRSCCAAAAAAIAAANGEADSGEAPADAVTGVDVAKGW